MSRRIENECVGCAECRACWRLFSYSDIIVCDICGEDLYEEDNAYSVDGKDYCIDCLVEMVDSLYYDMDLLKKAEVLGFNVEKQKRNSFEGV